MALEINCGFAGVIAVFEDGWLAGVSREDRSPPSYVEPLLRQYWLDGYHTGISDNQGSAYTDTTMH